jgi:hypothetical protein
VPNDPSKQQTGINFSNYDDIPVEASGNDVPEIGGTGNVLAVAPLAIA